jgi:hypothetical protein
MLIIRTTSLHCCGKLFEDLLCVYDGSNERWLYTVHKQWKPIRVFLLCLFLLQVYDTLEHLLNA